MIFRILRTISFLALFSSFLFLTGCSTVESRIRDNPAIFQSLSPADQTLVRTGQIRTGLDQDTVYLAWGRPDHIRHEVRKSQATETWTYQGAYVQEIPRYRYYPGDWWYGIPSAEIYDPVLVSVPYVRKLAVFQNNRVVAFEY